MNPTSHILSPQALLLIVACSSVSYNAVAQQSKAPKKAEVKLVTIPVDADAAAKRLSDGVKFRTISNQDRTDFDEKAFKDWHAFLEKTYPLAHKTLKKEILGSPRSFSLLYTWQGSKPELAPVVLMGHQDVVPVVPGTESQWTHDAYSGDIADGYIWGRGTLDDKISIMAILESIEMHLQKGFKPVRTIYLAFGQDEEVGGPEGAKVLVKELENRGLKEIAFVLDEGYPVAPELFPGVKNMSALIGTAEKGYLSLELKVNGVGGHSSLPPLNSNIGILSQAITKLEANPFPYKVTQVVHDQFNSMGFALPEETQKMLANDETTIEFMKRHPMTRAMSHTTTAVTMINGGVKENVLPPIATAVVNFRILPGETIQSTIDNVVKTISDERVTVTDISASINPSPISCVNCSEYQMMEKTIRQTWGTPELIVAPTLIIGGNDAKFFAASPIAKNVYRLTPVRVETFADTQRLHGVNERILVSEYAKSIGFFYQLITNLKELK